MSRIFADYVDRARRILEDNWTGQYTKPALSLYPHQWNWDSGFIAIGKSHYDTSQAIQEIEALFEAQWLNGMIPQIVFNPEELGHYFPEPDFWQVPGGIFTSGITMPPLHAIACRHIFEEAKDRKNAHDFLKVMFPKLMASHSYFYQFRDPNHSGLVYIRHPWESGLDNSPAWDGPLGNIKVDKRKLPSYERKDLKHGVPPEQRPGNEDYDRYVYLVDLFRRLKYKEEDIYGECPFLIQDVLFNSILCRANRDLMEIGAVLKEDTGELAEWTEQTARAISERLWCEPCTKFEDFDLVTDKLIHTATAANFMPLFAGAATKHQAEIIYSTLNSVSFCALHQGNCFTIPNYDMTRDDFDPQNYWRGPVWININWMLSQGLKGYGYKQKADAMKKDMIQLPIRFGFHEYFDSQTGKGYGSGNFSWTAALFLDLVYEYYDEDKHSFKWLKLGKSRRLKETKVLNQGTGDQVPPSTDVACNLMATMGDLKERFYNLNRGLVDYEAMKHSPEYRNVYQRTSAKLQDFNLKQLYSLEENLAFWINLYNTIVVHGIVELGVSSSVREIPNFFSHIAYSIGGYTFSAEDIEHGILRANSRPPYRPFPLFRRNDPRRQFSFQRIDPRIHFALVCGSRSCAPIRFYEPNRIQEQLEIATKNFVNSSEVVILPEEKKILLSQIFNWYKRDFGGKKQMFEFVQRYLDQDKKSEFFVKNKDSIVVEYLFYDWNLNH